MIVHLCLPELIDNLKVSEWMNSGHCFSAPGAFDEKGCGCCELRSVFCIVLFKFMTALIFSEIVLILVCASIVHHC